MYQELVDLFVEKASAVSFKAISVTRAGTGNVQEAIDGLYYLLLVNGVEHEHATGRAPLPRELHFWKDTEQEGADALFLARLDDALKQAAASRFEGKLTIGELHHAPSHTIDLLQVVDLFTGAVSRKLNHPAAEPNHKDEFAEYVIDRLKPFAPETGAADGDLAVHLPLR